MLGYLKKEFKLNVASRYWNLKGSFKYYNQTVYFPKNSVIFQRAVKEGIYEHDILSIIFPLIKPDTEVFDIGANIGIMAIPMLTFDKTITVVSAEASPNSLPFLKKTNLLSPDKDRWVIIDKAIAEKAGKLHFHLASKDNGAYDSINDTKRANYLNVVEIEASTIDAIWQSRKQPEVSVIKSDIEGADLLALRGGIECIKKCKPSILVEWNVLNIKPFGFTNNDLYDFARSVNYEIYAIPALIKITSRHDFDLQSKYTENFLLVYNDNNV